MIMYVYVKQTKTFLTTFLSLVDFSPIETDWSSFKDVSVAFVTASTENFFISPVSSSTVWLTRVVSAAPSLSIATLVSYVNLFTGIVLLFIIDSIQSITQSMAAQQTKLNRLHWAVEG